MVCALTTISRMTHDDFRRVFFERYAEDDDTFDDDWFDAFFDNASMHGYPAWMDIDWDHETDCGNVASGDQSETLFSFSDAGFDAYWTRSTFNGLQGPFETYKEAVESLGYDPESFPPPQAEVEEEDGGGDATD